MITPIDDAERFPIYLYQARDMQQLRAIYDRLAAHLHPTVTIRFEGFVHDVSCYAILLDYVDDRETTVYSVVLAAYRKPRHRLLVADARAYAEAAHCDVRISRLGVETEYWEEDCRADAVEEFFARLER